MAIADEVVGTEFSVEFGEPAVEYPFNKVDLKFSGKAVSRSNSKYDPDFETSKIGRKKCTLTLEGPYRDGEVELSVGDEVEVTYKPFSSHAGVTFTALITDIAHANDGDDGPRMTIDLINQSSFTPSISSSTSTAARATGRARPANRRTARAGAQAHAEAPPATPPTHGGAAS